MHSNISTENNKVSTELIEAKNIFLVEGDKTLLHDITLSISQGEIVTVIGPNGAGKTTLLNILLGLRKPSEGSIVRKADLRIGYMPQRLQLNPQLPLSVSRFLSLANLSNLNKVTPLNIDSALERTGVSHIKHSAMMSLSGGEIQRVLLARALLRQPQLLVLDEPVQGVDVGGQNQLYDLIRELRDDLNCGVIMVSHDLHLVMAATDHVICLNQHICCHGHPQNVSNDPAYLELFGSVATNFATYSHHHDHKHDLHGEVLDDSHSHCSPGDH